MFWFCTVKSKGSVVTEKSFYKRDSSWYFHVEAVLECSGLLSFSHFVDTRSFGRTRKEAARIVLVGLSSILVDTCEISIKNKIKKTKSFDLLISDLNSVHVHFFD